MHRMPRRLSISPAVEAPQMKKIAANIQIGFFRGRAGRLRRATAEVFGEVRPSRAWSTRTTDDGCNQRCGRRRHSGSSANQAPRRLLMQVEGLRPSRETGPT